MFLEFNYGYHLCVSYKENYDLYFKSKTANKLVNKLKELMTLCQENFCHA